MTDQQADEWFEMRKEKAVAYGKPVLGGFHVSAGSTAMRDGSSLVKRDRGERDRMISDVVLIEHDAADLLEIADNHVFLSQSKAAGVVIDGNSNGSHWVKFSENSPASASATLNRNMIERAIDRYVQLKAQGFGPAYPWFAKPTDYWLRLTRKEQTGSYPIRPIVALALDLPQVSDGWPSKQSAAVRLLNAGFIVVGANNEPVSTLEGFKHLTSDADRIRACAVNYYIDPDRSGP